MEWPTIPKPSQRGDARPNLVNYDETCRAFRWEDAREQILAGHTAQSINIADIAAGAQLRRGLGDKTALRWIARDGSRRLVSYDELARQSSRFASALEGLGIAKGGVVFSLLGRIPELYIAALGTWKRGAVFCPLFSAFGPEPARARMEIAGAKALVTTERLYRRKIAPIRDQLPSLERIILVGGGEKGKDFNAMLSEGDEAYETAATAPDDLATLHFTSGTTGKPKGAMHVHEAVITHHVTARFALDLREDDIFWCTADPGWVTGTSYGIIAPLTIGCTMLSDEQDFDAERWYKVLADEKVTVWYTAPTAIRMLMKAGAELPKNTIFRTCDLSPASANRSTPKRWSGGRRLSACRSTIIGGSPKPAAS